MNQIEKIIEERQRLVYKKFNSGLSDKEEDRLLAIDRIVDVYFDDIDRFKVYVKSLRGKYKDILSDSKEKNYR